EMPLFNLQYIKRVQAYSKSRAAAILRASFPSGTSACHLPIHNRAMNPPFRTIVLNGDATCRLVPFLSGVDDAGGIGNWTGGRISE
ncbi:hypothetical protein PMAYCL1PPCAC_19948, partial [Pristionchus mayeri]